jgi:hypothetical protein
LIVARRHVFITVIVQSGTTNQRRAFEHICRVPSHIERWIDGGPDAKIAVALCIATRSPARIFTAATKDE